MTLSFSPSPMASTLSGWISRCFSSWSTPLPFEAPAGRICNNTMSDWHVKHPAESHVSIKQYNSPGWEPDVPRQAGLKAQVIVMIDRNLWTIQRAIATLIVSKQSSMSVRNGRGQSRKGLLILNCNATTQKNILFPMYILYTKTAEHGLPSI